MSRLALAAVVFVTAIAVVGRADEVSDKQKAVALEHIKTSELKGYGVVESATLILASPLPETRSKAVAEALEKTAKTARKGLQFGDKEDAWKGKLTVYHIPDRKLLGNFLRTVAGERSEVSFYVGVRGDEPYAASSAEAGPKASDADIAADLGPAVGAAYFQSKAGPATSVPAWVRGAYGRAASLRSDAPTGKRLVSYKTAAKGTVLGKGRGPATLAEVWAGDRPDAELVATSLLDYMAFGTDKMGQEKFTRFVSNLRPDENGDSPEITKVVETAGWKWQELENGWRSWAAKGMPVK
ncbi:MAG TPA: hypothetical protein VH092_28595 [Urbifossiella sp.]|nr:hypothetical protein [Urbifossiella sp.]